MRHAIDAHAQRAMSTFYLAAAHLSRCALSSSSASAVSALTRVGREDPPEATAQTRGMTAEIRDEDVIARVAKNLTERADRSRLMKLVMSGT
jgi:hypothetical protein